MKPTAQQKADRAYLFMVNALSEFEQVAAAVACLDHAIDGRFTNTISADVRRAMIDERGRLYMVHADLHESIMAAACGEKGDK